MSVYRKPTNTGLLLQYQSRVDQLYKRSSSRGLFKINMHRRDFLLKKARKTNNSEDWANYRCCRNGVSNSIRKAKASYNHRLIKDSGKDQKAFWKTMKKILPGEKTAVSPKINTGQSITTDRKTIARAFNKFFVGAATRLLECLPSASSSSTGSQNIHHIIVQHPAFNLDVFHWISSPQELFLSLRRAR